jgi:broad specificity phosphatase PhoE
MQTLILVKHSVPEIVPTLPASQWRLSPEGQQRCHPLAELIAPYQPDVILTSQELKAIETGQLLASFLNLSAQTWPDLHEHCRDQGDFLASRQEFEQRITELFQSPDQLVFGSETAVQATHRFTTAMNRVLIAFPRKTVVIVAHGTVISLYVGACTGIDAYALWQRLQLPSFVVLARPEYTVEGIIERVPISK